MNQEIDIEKLFSGKFEHFEVNSSEEDWRQLSSRLKVSNFLKFSVMTFNIYYLVALFAFAGTATYSGIRNYALNKKIDQLETTIKAQEKKETNVSLSHSHLIINEPVKSEVKVNPKPVIQKKAANLEIIPAKKTASFTDTIKIAADPLQIDTTYNRKTKIKRTIVVKRDRVVIKDTTKLLK
jgi:cell division protein FtsL